jgi:3',5'-cyclic AMP phosphodiesterase CpdA
VELAGQAELRKHAIVMIRVLHFSDVHVDVPLAQMPARGMLGKRLLGAANLMLRRKRLFAQARAKLAALGRFAEWQAIDLVICTGDYTALGTLVELEAARRAIEPLTRRARGFVTVPGNHDLYVPDTVADARFERTFGDLLGTDWPEHAVDGAWPAVRLYDRELAVVSVNSARPNPQLLRSSGRIPDQQLVALRAVLADTRLVGRTVLVATHYAPRRKDGSPDRFSHGLENADELLEICARAPRAAILHGHIHWRYHLQPRGNLHLFGAGSATHRGREGLWLFEVDAGRVRAVPGSFADGDYRLDEAEAIAF